MELVQIANQMAHMLIMEHVEHAKRSSVQAPYSLCESTLSVRRVLITSCRANGLGHTIDEGSACASIVSATSECTLIKGARRTL